MVVLLLFVYPNLVPCSLLMFTVIILKNKIKKSFPWISKFWIVFHSIRIIFKIEWFSRWPNHRNNSKSGKFPVCFKFDKFKVNKNIWVTMYRSADWFWLSPNFEIVVQDSCWTYRIMTKCNVKNVSIISIDCNYLFFMAIVLEMMQTSSKEITTPMLIRLWWISIDFITIKTLGKSSGNQFESIVQLNQN